MENGEWKSKHSPADCRPLIADAECGNATGDKKRIPVTRHSVSFEDYAIVYRLSVLRLSRVNGCG
jgi:hypothetical protein